MLVLREQSGEVCRQAVSYRGISSKRRFLAGALLCTLALSGCGSSSQTQSRSDAGATKQPAVKNVPQQAQIFEDEARLKGSQAVIGGTVRNVSNEKLEDLSVDIELRPRKGGENETRQVRVVPANLAPGEEGRYSITVLSRDWSGSRVLRLKSGSRPDEIVFKSAPGAKRPPERPPQDRERIVVVPRPKPKGEEFINTPDTAEPIH